jgi:hypothetical protein
LKKIAGPVAASTESNGADWHLGVLRLTNDGKTEDWNFSGVYIESGDITTSIVSPGGSGAAPSSSKASSSSSSVTTVIRTPTTTSSSTKAASTTSTKPASTTTTLPESSCKVEYVYV